MIKTLFFLILFFSTTFAKEFSIATYNVENFFDLKHDKSEYKEYIPYKYSKWNRQTFNTKLKNILKVINDLNKDIIVLQEIESQNAFTFLEKNLPKYKFSSFRKYKNSSVGLAILSTFKIEENRLLHIKHSKVNRPIVKTTLNIENNRLIIYNNHWPSKRNGENQRVLYAQRLENEIKNLNKEDDYIIIGDLNSNYNESETFKFSKLNNTYGLTGINHILKTKIDDNFIKKSDILTYRKNVHYNLWLDLDYHNRFSYFYKGKKETPDNIIVPKSMFDNKNINYVNNSFNVFKAEYLIKNKKINRWKIKKGVHKNSGFSDHLPVYASFSTSKQINIKKQSIKNIDDLYKYNDRKLPETINNIYLLYKTDTIAVVKQKNNRAIFIYKNVEKLKFNKEYSFKIKKLKNFNGLLEIVDYEIVNEKNNTINKEELFLEASKSDILNNAFQNEIIKNLNGTYKDNFLYYTYKNEKKKIKLYSKNKSLLPKNGEKITIINSHLGFFRSKPQIIIYKKSDYKYAD